MPGEPGSGAPEREKGARGERCQPILKRLNGKELALFVSVSGGRLRPAGAADRFPAPACQLDA